MQILAVRLKEVGRFRDGIVVEGFEAGLNVLAAANEAGKSTILRALVLLFRVSHQANNKDVRRLRPDYGGAPQIACDFEIDGGRWRLTKQYLAGRSAELRQLDGSAVYRGGEAEDKLQDMLAGAGGLGEAMDLLWVEQGQSFKPPEISAEQHASFTELVQEEIDQVTGAGRVSEVLERVRKDLFELVTAKNRNPKRGGRLANAIADRAAAEEAYQVAQGKAERALERERRLSEIGRREAELGAAAAVEAREKALGDAKGHLASAQDARVKYDVALAKSASAEHALRSAQAELQAFDTALAEIAQGAQQRTRLVVKRAELVEAIGQAEAQITAHDETARALQGRRHDAQQAQVAAERAVRWRQAQARNAELSRRLADVRVAEETIVDLRKRYAAIEIEPEDVERIRVLEDDLRHLRHHQANAAAWVKVHHGRSGDRRFRVAGAALEDGQGLRVVEALRIVADGVGEVEIAPGDVADVARRIDELETALGDHIARLGVADRAAAEARISERAELERQGQELAARINGLAPDGLAALEAQRSEAAAFVEAADGDTDHDDAACNAGPTDDGGLQLAEIDRQLTAVAAEHREAVNGLMAQREALARVDSERESLDRRLAVIIVQLPAEGAAREAARAELVAVLEAAQGGLNSAVREREAWREMAPDDDALAALEAGLAEQEQVVRKADRELADLREARREIEGGLGRDVEDGVAADASAKHERLERLVERERDIRREADALGLLERELAEVVATQRAHLAEPVVQRLAGYAELVFPGVGFRLNDAFMVEALERGGGHEVFEQLSDGTREQIGILVRLALAQCIAERQAALPVIFDDAMVYSDDGRLAQLFAVLEQAGRRHQVIVLTCHARSFVPLAEAFGGTALRLSER